MTKRQRKKQFKKRYGSSPRQYEVSCRETATLICEWMTDLCERLIEMVRDIASWIVQQGTDILDDIDREGTGQGRYAYTEDGG